MKSFNGCSSVLGYESLQKTNEITLDSSFNEFTYRYNLQTISSEESWLGIDLFGNDPSGSWWTVSGNEFRSKH